MIFLSRFICFFVCCFFVIDKVIDSQLRAAKSSLYQRLFKLPLGEQLLEGVLFLVLLSASFLSFSIYSAYLPDYTAALQRSILLQGLLSFASIPVCLIIFISRFALHFVVLGSFQVVSLSQKISFASIPTSLDTKLRCVCPPLSSSVFLSRRASGCCCC